MGLASFRFVSPCYLTVLPKKKRVVKAGVVFPVGGRCLAPLLTDPLSIIALTS